MVHEVGTRGTLTNWKWLDGSEFDIRQKDRCMTGANVESAACGRQAGPARRPWLLSARILIISSISAIIGFSAICASVMLDLRHDEAALAHQALENLVAGIDADIGRNIEQYDLSLRAVAANMLLPEVDRVSKSILHLILFDQTTSASHFGAIQVFDATGRMKVDSSTLDPQPEDRSDEDYFRVHRDHPDAGLFISRPALYRGAYAIVLSRRISAPDGSFRGVVVGSIRFSYFHELFNRLNLDPDDSITVLSRNGTVIMRTPFDLDYIGKNLAQVPGVARALTEPSGWYSSHGALDQVPRLMVWRDGTKPLVVLAGKSWDSIYSLWRKQAGRIGAMMLALIGFVLAATLVAAREISRRASAEDRLEELATTDALTGLKNRRSFDATIEGEWRRTLRQRTALSLLMIDADGFKSYNDTHGHQAGDQVLVGIAICIADSVRRASDCAARYGGEEFAVLLPGLAQPDALRVAETIRAKVEQWSGQCGVSTVSIGVASVTPSHETDWAALLQAADKALYAAKAAGRNRCIAAALPELSLVA
jgi:diguanylate cyclase (GGDEF)-like protein